MRDWRIDSFHRCFVLDRPTRPGLIPIDTGDIDIKEALNYLFRGRREGTSPLHLDNLF